MKMVTVMDPSIGSENIGDQIISSCVKQELKMMFSDDQIMLISVPSHERIGLFSRRVINNSNWSFVGGSNLLSSKYHLVKNNQWNISPLDALSIKNTVLMGVGWSNYQNNPSLLTKFIYNSALSRDYIHSVRDSYTKSKLESIGIKNVYNTGCPTLWRLTKEHCLEIPHKKGKNVICTLTDYSANQNKDLEMLKILIDNYSKVYFWIQGSRDLSYLRKLTNLNPEISESISLVNPTLDDYDKILESREDLDYVGTRLHAGIRALQKKRRSIIIGIDNRAIEMQKDFNLTIVKRENIDQLKDQINSEWETKINIDSTLINEWKSQFIK